MIVKEVYINVDTNPGLWSMRYKRITPVILSEVEGHINVNWELFFFEKRFCAHFEF